MTGDELACDTALELVSATVDGEADSDERRRLDVHLANCAACRAFAEQVRSLDRLVRVRPAEPVPDLVDSVMMRARPAVLGRGGWLRPALAWVAIVMLAQNVAALTLGRVDGADPHLARHLGAFGVAMAIGFAYVAWRPHRAYGMLPFAAALTVTMLLSAGFDVFDGQRRPLTETAHLTEIAGLALLWMIAGSPGSHRFSVVRRRNPRHPSTPA